MRLIRRRIRTTTLPIATAILRRCRSGVDGKHVTSLQDVGVVAGSEDLLVQASPLGLVDAADPVLHLQHDAAVRGDGAGEVRVIVEALRLLERQRAVLVLARKHLEGLLVGVDLELDAGPRGLEARHEFPVGAPVVGLFAVDEPAVVCYVYV